MRPGKRKAHKHTPWGAILEQAEKPKAGVRAKVEHPFRVIKRQFGHTKARYRGLAKNTAQLITLFALSNIWMARKVLLQRARACVRLQAGKRLPSRGNITGNGRNWLRLPRTFPSGKTYSLMTDSQAEFWT